MDEKDDKTRNEIIRCESKQFQLTFFGDNKEGMIARSAFKAGAEWADKNPNKKSSFPWISVEEELPRMSAYIGEDLTITAWSEPVLTWRLDGEVSMHCLCSGLDGKLWWGGYNGTLKNSFEGSAITHWVPFDRVEPKNKTL